MILSSCSKPRRVHRVGWGGFRRGIGGVRGGYYWGCVSGREVVMVIIIVGFIVMRR